MTFVHLRLKESLLHFVERNSNRGHGVLQHRTVEHTVSQSHWDTFWIMGCFVFEKGIPGQLPSRRPKVFERVLGRPVKNSRCSVNQWFFDSFYTMDLNSHSCSNSWIWTSEKRAVLSWMITAFSPHKENEVILVETANVDVFWSYIYKKEMVEL